MGLYDGGAGGSGCTAQLAALLGLPVLLVLNAHGLGQSVAALAEGFLRHRPAWSANAGQAAFAGMICTHVGSEKHREILRQALAPLVADAGVPLLGLLPRDGAPRLESRHLGLVEARESLLGLDRDALAAWLEVHCDLDALLRALGAPLGGRPQTASQTVPPAASRTQELTGKRPVRLRRRCREGRNSPLFPAPRPRREKRRPCRTAGLRLLLGVARDAAFSFCYADSGPAAGMATWLFSRRSTMPRRRRTVADSIFPAATPSCMPPSWPPIPPCVRARLWRPRACPVYGECGGYIYLMRELHLEGQGHAMSGLLPLGCRMGDRLAALGYRAARALPGWPANVDIPGRHGTSARP